MARRSVLVGLMMAIGLTATSAVAQSNDQVIDRDRPDGFGPPGVTGHFVMEAGEILWSFTYTRDDLLGNRSGTTPLFQDDILDDFTVAPISLNTQTLNLELRFGVTDRVTIAASAPFILHNDLNETETTIFGGHTNDIGDVKANMLVSILPEGPNMLSVGMGVSIPVGEIDERGQTATSSRAQLPFNMQTGSGSWDLLPSVSFITQNEFGTFGAQASSTIRLNENDRGYKLGDRFDMTAWLSYNISDWIALSARVLREEWGTVTRSDPDTNALEDPRANPFATGGIRIRMPLGLTLHMREGVLKGHRFSVEYFYPIKEDLNGPQLSFDETILLGWQVAF